MKRGARNNNVNSYLSNNPMLDAESLVDLPIINAQAYDVPLPYTDSTRHMRGVRKKEEAENETLKKS